MRGGGGGLGLGGQGAARAREVAVGCSWAPPPCSLVAAASLPWTLDRADDLRAAGPGVSHEAKLQRTLPGAIRLAGGRGRLLACGAPVTQLYATPRVAWAMHVHLGDVHFKPRRTGVVLQARRRAGAPWLPAVGGDYRELAATGPWRVVGASCPR